MADNIRRQSSVHGAHAAVPNNNYEDKWFEIEPPYRVWRFMAYSFGHLDMTWNIIGDVVEGLRLYLEDSGRNRQAYFKIERRVAGNLEVIGWGFLYTHRES